MLEIKNLTKSFGGLIAVNNCSFEVEENTVTSLIGPNGAGKTTIFNLLSGLLTADKGKVSLANHDISHLPPYLRAEYGLARTFQLIKHFKYLSVQENLLLALDSEDQKFWLSIIGKNKDTNEEINKIKEILGLLGIEEKLEAYPNDLSYGQQKLLALARVLLQPHKLLLLDEPVAGINPGLRQELKKILLNLKTRNETILLIEHDMDFVMDISDKVIVMSQGKILKEGLPREVQNDPEVLEVYLGES